MRRILESPTTVVVLLLLSALLFAFSAVVDLLNT